MQYSQNTEEEELDLLQKVADNHNKKKAQCYMEKLSKKVDEVGY